ncbi:MAG: extracellular solute-binding protein, partial [Anaerolineae bacterium]|nr:extracellular solute-binding protein [Anaerolineae bacterium]
MKQRIPFFVVSVVIVLAMLLGACAPAAATEAPVASDATEAAVTEAAAAVEPVTIKVVSFLTYSENADGAESKVVEAFQAAHPEITVDFQLLPYADYFTSLKTWVAGGTAPDVASLDLSMLQEMAAAGSLADLTPMVDADGYDLSQYYQ